MPLATNNFLIPNGTFIVVLLAFLAVLGVIGKYVLPILNKALTERQDKIRGELEAADRAKADAEEADTERRALLEQARAQARDILSQAATAADQAKLRAEADAQAIHDRIVQSADAEVVIARQAAVEEVTARVGEIVLAAAERVIGREIQATDHQDLIDEAIAAVRAESADAGAGAGAGAAPEPAQEAAGERCPSGLPGGHGRVAVRHRRARRCRLRARLGGRPRRRQHRAHPGHQRRVGAGPVPPVAPRPPARGQGPTRGAAPRPPGRDRGAGQ